MTVLSDQEIRIEISAGRLVPRGDSARATECSYSFLPGRAFLAGSKDPPIDFPGTGGKARLIVEPGRMVWVRTSETVDIPPDVAGFWWQTNTLSKKGLMLVNMSMVEPGYSGDLACLFVNFGKTNILIDAETPIAKMVFVDIRGKVGHPYTARTSRKDYDRKLEELAMDQPMSFLQVGELAQNLSKEREAALADIRSAKIEVKQGAEADIKAAREEAITQFKKDVPGTIKSQFWLALALFAVLTAVNVASLWIQGKFVPNVKETARAEAEDVFRERTTVSAAPSAADATLGKRLDALNQRLDALEKHK